MNDETRPVDPVDEQEEHNPDEQVWDEFAEQVDSAPQPEPEPEPEPEAPQEEPEPAEAEAAAPAEPEAAVEPEPEPEPAPEAQPEAVPAEPETPPEPQPAPQFAPAAVRPEAEPPLTDEQRRERIAGLRKAAIEEAERSYALDENTENEYLQSPGKVLPKLAAQVQMTTQEVVINEVLRMLPTAVAMEMERRRNADSFWGEFEQEWPKLTGRRPELERMAATYQAMNPGTDRPTLIRNVGASAHLAFKIPIEEAPATAPAVSPVPAHRPVTSAAPAAPAPKLNAFEQYAVELENDDE